jgi:hypothetical protein
MMEFDNWSDVMSERFETVFKKHELERFYFGYEKINVFKFEVIYF